MQVHIVGHNRAEICKIKNRDVEKHFFTSRRMLFKVYADGLTRCKRTRYGRPDTDEEIIIYKENAIIPYHPRQVSYLDWKICAEIDEHKKMLTVRQSPLTLISKGYKSIAKELSGGLTAVIMAGVLIYAFIL